MQIAVSAPENLRHVLNETELRWLAGERAFVQGQELAAVDNVRLSESSSAHFQAIVDDGRSFVVSLQLLRNADIDYKCDCESGLNELFCSHCVAGALAWLSQETDSDDLWADLCSDDFAESHEDILDKTGRTLAGMTRESLIELLLAWGEKSQANAETLFNLLQETP